MLVKDLQPGTRYMLHSWDHVIRELKEKMSDFSGYRLVNTDGTVYCNISPEFRVQVFEADYKETH